MSLRVLSRILKFKNKTSVARDIDIVSILKNNVVKDKRKFYDSTSLHCVPLIVNSTLVLILIMANIAKICAGRLPALSKYSFGLQNIRTFATGMIEMWFLRMK